MRSKCVHRNDPKTADGRWLTVRVAASLSYQQAASAAFLAAVSVLACSIGTHKGYSQSPESPAAAQQPASPWSKPFPAPAPTAVPSIPPAVSAPTPPASSVPARVSLHQGSVQPASPTAPATPVAKVQLLNPMPAVAPGSPSKPNSATAGMAPLPPSASATAESAAGNWNRVPALGIPLAPSDGTSATALRSAPIGNTAVLPPSLPAALPERLPANPPNLPPPAIVRLTPGPSQPSPTQERIVSNSGQRRIGQGLPDQKPVDRLESSNVSNVRTLPTATPVAPSYGSFPTSRLLFSSQSATIPTPAQWQPTEIEVRQRLDRCDALLKRNAIQSARDEVLQALQLLVRHTEHDLHERGMLPIQQPSRQSKRNHPLEDALQQALVTLDECPDFHETIQYSAKRIERIVEHHKSTALKNQNLSDMTNERARAAYLEHVKKMMVISTQHHPWAAELLYALAKTYERELAVDATRPITLRSQSVACLEAAYQIAPTYSYIANELGYSLIQAQRLQDAQAVLLNVVKSEPSAPAWRNLAEVYRRRGASQDAQQALERAAAMENR